jgi:hypothetical protein
LILTSRQRFTLQQNGKILHDDVNDYFRPLEEPKLFEVLCFSPLGKLPLCQVAETSAITDNITHPLFPDPNNGAAFVPKSETSLARSGE